MRSNPADGLGNLLKNTIPKLKTHIQLSAFIVTLVTILLIRNFSPGNTPAQISGGMIGLSIIIFTLIINRIDFFPSKDRARIILTLFEVLAVVVVILVGVTGYFLLRQDKRVYQSLYDQVQGRLEKRETELKAELLDKAAQRARAAAADKYEEWVQLGNALEGLRKELDAVQVRRQSVANTRTQADALVEEVKRVSRDASRQDRQTVANLARQADQAFRRGDIKEAEDLFSAMGTSGLHQAAYGQFWLGKLAELQANYVGALERFRDAYKLEPTNARYLTALAETYETLGDFKEAKRYYAELVDKLRGNPAKRVELAVALTSTANVTRFVDESDAARREYEEALDIIENPKDSNEKAVKASVANDFGAFYAAGGDYVNSEKYYQISLSTYREIGGTDIYGFADILNNMGQLYVFMGQFRRAVDLLNEALTLTKDALGTDTVLYAISTRNIGLAYLGWGDLDSAKGRFERALGIIERVLGKETTAYARTEGLFAECLESAGEMDRAEAEATTSLRRLEIAMGPESAFTGMAHLRIAEIEI